MLSKFYVEGFKCFKNKFEINLSKTCNYEFNTSAILNHMINKALIYGFNGCGKSNLGLALFDIISHLTDKQCNSLSFEPYLYLDNDSKLASFKYEFIFENQKVEYSYQKSAFNTLVNESLKINEREVIYYDFLKHKGNTKLKGTENLNLDKSDSELSRVKFISSNTILPDTLENKAFKQFIHFVNNMLLFFSLERNGYLGFQKGADSIEKAIVTKNKTKDFESFLKSCNINITLEQGERDGEPLLLAKYGNSYASFYKIASSGTKALALFYYWYLVIDKASFVFIDEFDAFYHYELSEKIVNLLKEIKNTQILLTTHNTDLLSNDLLRPDCLFWMNESSIKPICDLTEKELRKAHNLQKMFKAGAFNDK